MAVMGTRGIQTFSRSLRYRNQTVTLPDGTLTVTLVGQEKGVDVRIALDIVRFALDGKYDVALIFSQDQDLSEAVQDVKNISVFRIVGSNPRVLSPQAPRSPRQRESTGRIGSESIAASTIPRLASPGVAAARGSWGTADAFVANNAAVIHTHPLKPARTLALDRGSQLQFGSAILGLRRSPPTSADTA
jgi:hypothetical protein